VTEPRTLAIPSSEFADLQPQTVSSPPPGATAQTATPSTPEPINVERAAAALLIESLDLDMNLAVEVRTHPRLARPLQVNVRPVTLLHSTPWVRSLSKLTMKVTTQAWRFPTPGEPLTPPKPRLFCPEMEVQGPPLPECPLQLTEPTEKTYTRLRPPTDLVQFKDRLLYLLQPPLEDLFAGRQVSLPFQPYPYQLKGIAFLIPRHAALIADEMGLGKTAQVIIALRLMLHGGLIQSALVVCPKPLVINWTRELRLWAEDVPFEIIGGDTQLRKATWFHSRCPIKLVNYELLTRDADWVADDRLHFDVVVLDEAQRIKNKESKTSQVVRSLHRSRSWAMSGTPIENRIEDLVNIFAFLDPDRIPPDTPARLLPQLTCDCIIRRIKEEVATDMPPKVIRDAVLELSAAQRQAYDLAEKEGVVHLNELGETISVQHVFELVMRLKQICNFDPLTGNSAKQEQLLADIAEVADSGRKAIIFSQWVDPLERLARVLAEYGTLLYHGKVPHRDRQPILDLFKRDPARHVLLMSYGTGSVGLNLQFCNYVFLFDRWWNPAIEDQAINRAHRLGQKEPVFVTRFISQGTIEERIAEILEKKRQLFHELIAQSGPPPALGLTEDEIFGLFEIKNRPRRAAA
jgi:SNF2 family DNA or RNA helicase